MNNIKPFNGIKSFSKNKDGVLSIEEIFEMDSSDDEDDRLENATNLMNLYDTNYDGKLSKEEFVKAYLLKGYLS